jgi:hypothetical protein
MRQLSEFRHGMCLIPCPSHLGLPDERLNLIDGVLALCPRAIASVTLATLDARIVPLSEAVGLESISVEALVASAACEDVVCHAVHLCLCLYNRNASDTKLFWVLTCQHSSTPKCFRCANCLWVCWQNIPRCRQLSQVRHLYTLSCLRGLAAQLSPWVGGAAAPVACRPVTKSFRPHSLPAL